MKWKIKLSSCLYLIAFFSVSSELIAAKPRAGLSLGIGLGGIFSADLSESDAYQTHFYPEFQIAVDLAFIKAGLTAGWIERRYLDPCYGTSVLCPQLADLSLLPLRFFAPRSPFQIFLGVSGGVLWVVFANETGGSPDEPEHDRVYFCAGPKFGFEFYLGDRIVVNLEGRWLFVPSRRNLDYFNALLGIRFRFPFKKNSGA